MPDPDLRISAVVVTYNRLELLQRLVKALTDVPELGEVLIVDNASTDGTGEWLASLDVERVQTRTLEHNIGGAGGFPPRPMRRGLRRVGQTRAPAQRSLP